MAVKPLKAEAVLFYSQHPNGQVDLSSLHGGCPVLQGTKWAANLWVWNGPRMPYLLQARRREQSKKNSIFSKLSRWIGWMLTTSSSATTEVTPTPHDDTSVLAIFRNDRMDVEELKLYWQGQEEMGSLGLGQEIHLNSYVGHHFTVKAHGQVEPFSSHIPSLISSSSTCHHRLFKSFMFNRNRLQAPRNTSMSAALIAPVLVLVPVILERSSFPTVPLPPRPFLPIRVM